VRTDLDHARALDASDPLAAYRDRFVAADPSLVYLDGNSLGRLPRATAERLRVVVEAEWGGELIRAWDHWIDLPTRVGDAIGGLIGARPGEVVVADSTTVNLYRLAAAALDARPGRMTVVVSAEEFPTDRYVVGGLARERDLEIRRLGPDRVAGTTVADIEAALDDDVALVILSAVDYRSAAIADLPAITASAREAGAIVLWDLSHAVGSIPLDLTAAGVELAAGCTYKYLNGGPGSPAFLFVHRELHDELRPPVAGWMGNRDIFAMGPTWEPADAARRFVAGTPSVLALAAIEEGVRLVTDAGIDEIRAKGIALTEYAIVLHDEWLGPLGCTLGSPRDAACRGAHVAIRHPDAGRLSAALIDGGVVVDFRAPDVIRVGCSPLSTSFGDIWTGLDRLRRLVA
jgi:kynureninase